MSDRKMRTILLWLLVVLSGFVFLVQGPLRARSSYANDFAAPYTSARLWLQRKNPYDAALFWPTWQAAGAPLTQSDGRPVYANPSSTHSVYPPPSIVVLAPFAWMSWAAACIALVSLSTATYLLAIFLLSRLLPGTWREAAKPIFLSLALLLAPMQSALHVSNVSALAGGLLLIAVALLLGSLAPGRRVGIALLLGLSLALKPTLAPLMLIYLVRKRLWSVLLCICALGTLATAGFQLLQPDWLWFAGLRANINFLFTQGVADLAERNLTRSDRIDLQLPLYMVSHSRNAAVLGACVVATVLLLVWIKTALKPGCNIGFPAGSIDLAPKVHVAADNLPREMLVLSVLLVIGLIPVYQRFYSALVLLLPMLWALRMLSEARLRRRAGWVLAGCCVFLVNTSVLPRLYSAHIPRGGLLRPVIEVVMVSHLCWLILLLALLLLLHLREDMNQAGVCVTSKCGSSAADLRN